MVWNQILSHRAACDQFVKNLTGISLFVSSITGMLGKSPTVPGGKTIYPGVSYWVVLESADVDPRAIIRNVQLALQGQAEVKLLQEPPLISSIDSMQTTLCTVMKDHGNTYIKRRLSESQPEASDLSRVGTRLVIQPNELAPVARQAQEPLRYVGVLVDVVEY